MPDLQVLHGGGDHKLRGERPLGSVWTSVVTSLVDVKTRARQDIRESEMEEFRRIFASRALEIKSRINEIANF